MVKAYINYSDPRKYNDLVGIIADDTTAEENCKRKSKSSRVMVDPNNIHRPWCQCEPIYMGDGSPWEEFSCKSNKPHFVRICKFIIE